jgi:uncharacterized membrane protein
MTRSLAAYAAALVVIGVMDFVWLRLIAMSWYESGMGHLMAAKPNLVGAALFYFLFPVGVIVFAVAPAEGQLPRAVMLGALFGLFCYATFDLTALAVMKDYPAWLAAMDIAWGVAVGAGGAAAGTLAWRAVNA